jgi:hypothetical protein
MDEAFNIRSEGKRHVYESWSQWLRGISTAGIVWNENTQASYNRGVKMWGAFVWLIMATSGDLL